MMKLAFIILLTNFSFALASSAATPSDCKSIESAYWLAGDWQSKDKQKLISENWKIINGNAIAGVGITKNLKNLADQSKPPFIETLRIMEMSGSVFYLAKTPQNQYPVAFKLTRCSKHYLKFENPQHDFPKVIEYEKQSNGHVIAKVSDDNGNGFQVDYEKVTVNKTSKGSIIREYVRAYNQKDLAKMMTLVAPDIHWLSIANSAVSIETRDRQQLAEALKDHFSSAQKSTSSLGETIESGSFVSAFEKSTLLKANKASSQCSLSIYQFEKELIKNVWYFAAEVCE